MSSCRPRLTTSLLSPVAGARARADAECSGLSARGARAGVRPRRGSPCPRKADVHAQSDARRLRAVWALDADPGAVRPGSAPREAGRSRGAPGGDVSNTVDGSSVGVCTEASRGVSAPLLRDPSLSDGVTAVNVWSQTQFWKVL